MSQHSVPLPSELDRRFQGMALANESLMFSREYEKARDGFQQIYHMLCDEQPLGSRYHKGYPLHQIGMTFVLSGNSAEALRYFILAYIEDLLSSEEGEEDRADAAPAARNLRGVYKVDEGALSRLKTVVRDMKEARRVIRDPEDVFNQLAEGHSAHEMAHPKLTPDVEEQKRRVGQFQSDWGKRVFVGGSYSKHLAEINDIKVACKALGYDPVIAQDFDKPQGMEHHHALLLLHECKKAIFEVTDNVGQLMEIERLRDYGYKGKNVLIACQQSAHLSRMLEALLGSEGHQVRRYSSSSELRKVVTQFLT